MCIRPLNTQEDFNLALQLLELVWQAEKGTCDYDRFQIVVVFLEEYQRSRYPIELPDPIEAIKYFMDQLGELEETFSKLIGCQQRAKAILLKQEPLTLPLIWKLYKEWGIPPTLLIKPYELEEKEE